MIDTLSNDYGPNCYIVLESAGIPMYLSGTCKTVREAIGQFKAGKLPTIYTPTSAGPAAREFGHQHFPAVGIILGAVLVFLLSGILGI